MSSKSLNQVSQQSVDSTEDLVTTIINPFFVFSGSVHPDEYVAAQVELIQSLGIETYAQILLDTVHKEVSSIIEELKMEKDDTIRPNVSFMGEA